MIVRWIRCRLEEWIKSVVRKMFREEMITGGKGTWYIDNDKIGINASSPYLFLIDSNTGVEIDIRNEASTLNVVGAPISVSGISTETLATTSDVTVGGNISVTGGASISGSLSVGSGLSWKGGVLLNKAVTASAGAGAYGASVTISPNTGYNGIVPIAGSIVVASAGTGETITTQITASYSDGTTASITKAITGNGSVVLGVTDLETLIKDGVYITQLAVAAESSATSTTATSTVTIIGIEH